jgi:hypothetical protein
VCDTQELKLYTATVLDCLGVKVDALTAAGTRLLAVRGAAHAYSLRRRHRRIAARVTAATYGAPPARQVCGVVLSGWCGDVLNTGLRAGLARVGCSRGLTRTETMTTMRLWPPTTTMLPRIRRARMLCCPLAPRRSLPGCGCVPHTVEPRQLTDWCVQTAALEASHAVLADTVSEFSSVAAVLDRFGGWKRRFAATYKLAYAGESLFKVCDVPTRSLLF